MAKNDVCCRYLLCYMTTAICDQAQFKCTLVQKPICFPTIDGPNFGLQLLTFIGDVCLIVEKMGYSRFIKQMVFSCTPQNFLASLIFLKKHFSKQKKAATDAPVAHPLQDSGVFFLAT